MGRIGQVLDADDASFISPVPSETAKFRVDLTSNTISVLAASYTTVYSYSGSGRFYGGTLNQNSQNIYTRLTIDSNVIFDTRITDIALFDFDNTLNNSRTQMGAMFQINGNDLDVSFRYPIVFNSSVLIEQKSNTGSNQSSTARCIFITKVT